MSLTDRNNLPIRKTTRPLTDDALSEAVQALYYRRNEIFCLIKSAATEQRHIAFLRDQVAKIQESINQINSFRLAHSFGDVQ